MNNQILIALIEVCITSWAFYTDHGNKWLILPLTVIGIMTAIASKVVDTNNNGDTDAKYFGY